MEIESERKWGDLVLFKVTAKCQHTIGHSHRFNAVQRGRKTNGNACIIHSSAGAPPLHRF